MASANDIDRLLAAAARRSGRPRRKTGMTQVGPDKKPAFQNPGRTPPVATSAAPSGLSMAGGQAAPSGPVAGRDPRKLTNEATYRRIIRERLGVPDVRTATPEQLRRIRAWLPKRAGETRRGTERMGRG